MINNKNKGFGKFEVLTMIVLLLGISAFLMYTILGGANSQKLSSLKDNALNFGKTVATNFASFLNTNNVYLNDVISEGLLKNIKSPFSSGYCDERESKVEIIDGKAYATLKCDEYIIEKYNSTGSGDVNIYKVGKWSEKESGKNLEKKTLYNCKLNGKNMFDEYLEEGYMVSLINKDYNSEYFDAMDVSELCEVVTKDFYRTREVVEASE